MLGVIRARGAGCEEESDAALMMKSEARRWGGGDFCLGSGSEKVPGCLLHKVEPGIQPRVTAACQYHWIL